MNDQTTEIQSPPLLSMSRVPLREAAAPRPRVHVYPTARNILTILQQRDADLMRDDEDVKDFVEMLRTMFENGQADERIVNFEDFQNLVELMLLIDIHITSKQEPALSNEEISSFLSTLCTDHNSYDSSRAAMSALMHDLTASIPDDDAGDMKSAGAAKQKSNRVAIEAFEPKKYKRFIESNNESAKQKSHDFRPISDYKAKIQMSGGVHRWLAKLPEKWEEIVNEFDSAFPNLTPFSDFVRQHFALSVCGDCRVELPPSLLVGPPGVGKTEALRWLASKLNVSFNVIDVASMQTPAPLTGSEKHWSNSEPGMLFNEIALTKFANPMILLDELDKAKEKGKNYDPLAGLYQLLEPASSAHFTDISVPELTFDASHTIFVATANGTENIPTPILSRLTVFEIPEPTQEQARRIAQRIYSGLLKNKHYGKHFSSNIDDDVLDQLMHLPPRILRKAIESGLGAAALRGAREIAPDDIAAAVSKDKKYEMQCDRFVL